MTPERKREIGDAVREIITKQFEVRPEKVTDAAKVVDDLNADSLDSLELSMEIEERFNITIPEEEEQALYTVGSIIACVIRKLEEKEGGNAA